MSDDDPSIEDLDASVDGDMSHVEITAHLINDQPFLFFRPRSMEMYAAGTLGSLAAECVRLRDMIDRARAALGGLDQFTVETMAQQIDSCPPVIGRDARAHLANHLRESIRQAREILAEASSSEAPTYACPRCGAVSHNPNDLAARYCVACHVFEGDDPEASTDG